MAERENTKEFWQTLPGLLMGGATVIGAMASLIVAIYQFPTTHDQPSIVTTAPAARAESFEVIPTQDGYTSVREAPTTKSVEKQRLKPGTRIICQSVVKGELLWGSFDWRYCPNAGGYIHAKLLIPAR